MITENSNFISSDVTIPTFNTNTSDKARQKYRHGNITSKTCFSLFLRRILGSRITVF